MGSIFEILRSDESQDARLVRFDLCLEKEFAWDIGWAVLNTQIPVANVWILRLSNNKSTTRSQSIEEAVQSNSLSMSKIMG